MLGLIITLIISGLFSLLISFFTGYEWYIIYFISITILQFILWNIYKSLKIKYLKYLQKVLQIHSLGEFEHTLECASCHKTFPILLHLKDENIFKCPHCGQLNKLYIELKNVVYLENIQDINNAQNQIYNKLLEKTK